MRIPFTTGVFVGLLIGLLVTLHQKNVVKQQCDERVNRADWLTNHYRVELDSREHDLMRMNRPSSQPRVEDGPLYVMPPSSELFDPDHRSKPGCACGDNCPAKTGCGPTCQCGCVAITTPVKP